MSMVIAHNMNAINTKRNFSASARGMSGAMEKLSSGYKINTGKDDPSGLVISEQLRSQLAGLKRAQQNTEEAINVMGIAEGALNEMNSILKKMKALAIHSANNGVTSPEQVAADQAEMDSSIQTLDRIAQTTKFSDQNLLNGSKEITYDQDTLTKGTQQNALVNARESSFSQIFKRDGYSVSINFTGSTDADMNTGTGTVDFSQQAMKAYLEVDTALDAQPKPQVDTQGAFTQDQKFTLTGTKGSRSFTFKKGASVTDMVSQIKSAADSTGIGAALVFNSAQRIDKMSQGGEAVEVDQYINITGMPAKNSTQPVSLIISGSISGTNTRFDTNEVNFTIIASTVASGVVNSGCPQYTIIEGRTGKQVTLTLLPDGTVSGGTFSSGALAGIHVKGIRNLDLSQQLEFKTPVAIRSGSVLDSGTLGAVNATGLNASAKKVLVGASDVNMSTVLIVTNSGTGEGTLRVTINGVDTEGKAFSLVSEQKYTAANPIPAGGGNFTVTGGDLEGLQIGLTIANPLTLGAVAAGSVDLNPRYNNAGTMSVGNAIVRKQNVDGRGNVASLGSVGGTQSGRTAVRERGDAAVFNNTIAKDGSGNVIEGITSLSFGSGATQQLITQNSIQFGQNTDGQGRIYVKFNDDNSFELFKDAAMTEESKVATGVNGQPIRAVNNSGLQGLVLNLTGENLVSKKGVYLAFAGIEGYSATGTGSTYKEGVAYHGSVVNKLTPDANDPNPTFSGSAMFDAERTFITGVELGVNTADNATVYLKNVYDHTNGTVQVFAYKHADMRDEDMVAKSEIYSTRIEGNDAGSMTVVLNEVKNSDGTAGTGLGIVLSVDRAAFADQDKSATLTGSLVFTNLAARIFAQDYGSDAFVKVTQDKGAIFHEYGTPGDNNSKRLVDAGTTGTTVEVRGQDATLSVNGMQVKTDGLKLNLATQDVQADLTFNGGKVGSTTLAQVGYDVGSIFTKIGVLNLSSSKPDSDIDSKYLGLSGLLCNAGHNTNEVLGGFQNGMQLQLGEGAGDQNRTVVSIKDMTIDALGRVTKGGYWETGNCVWTEKTFTMKDVMGGGLACLKDDPILALSIIEQAVADVSENRALIGAMQANLLQTNSNNLSVTMENITKTESGLRDADMADEMTEFTKNQVLQNAAMSMMSTANQSAQQVLQLLQ